MAADISRVDTLARERTVVQSAGGYLRLSDPPLAVKEYLLRAGLPAEAAPVSLSVIKDIPLPVCLLYSAVVVALSHHAFLPVGIPLKDVRIVHDHTAVGVTFIRPVTDRVAEFVALHRGIDKIVPAVDLADGAGLEKLMTLEARALTVSHIRHQRLRLRLYRQHILLQCHNRGALGAGTVTDLCRSISRIKVNAAVFIDKNSRVKLDQIPVPVSQRCSVLVPYQPEEREGACGRVGYSDTDLGQEIQTVVQIIASVRAIDHIGSPHGVHARRIQLLLGICDYHTGNGRLKISGILRDILVADILFLSVNHALVAPLAQIFLRRGIADIVIEAEVPAAEAVMAAVHINSVAESVGFAVRHILVGRHIGIKYLFFHNTSLLF